MTRPRQVASGVAWFVALSLLIPGIGRYWTFLAFAGAPGAFEPAAFVIAYSVAGLCILLAFFWRARQRRLIFGAFVLTLLILNVYVGAPTLERILAFVTGALVIGIVYEFLRQNRPLFRALAAAQIRLTPILLKTLVLWSPALIFVGIGLVLNHAIVEQVERSLYDSALIDRYCQIGDAPTRPVIPCTTFDDRLPAGAIAELPLTDTVALHVETFFLLRRKAILERLSNQAPALWTNRSAIMKEITALQNAVQPTSVLGLQRVPERSHGNDPQIRTLNERLRRVHAELAGLQRSAPLRGLLAMLNPAYPSLMSESIRLKKAIQSREKALETQERAKDPAAFEINALRADVYTELAWINTAPAFRVLSLELNRRLDRKATPAEMSAAIRVGVLRIITQLEAETTKRLTNTLQKKHAVSAYDAGIVRPLCRLQTASGRENADVVIDCPAKAREEGWALEPVSFRESIDLSIERWHQLGEKELEKSLVKSGLVAARTAGEVKSSHANLWDSDSPLPRRIGLRAARCGLLEIGCHLSNYAKRSAEAAYGDARRDLRRTSIRTVNARADAGAATAVEQIDLARTQLYAGLAETQRTLDASIDQVAKTGAVVSALLQLWLALAILKSLLYVLATEVFHVRGPSEIGLASDSTEEGAYEVSTTIEIPTSFDTPLITSVVGVNQGKRTVVRQPFSAALTRLLHWKWALHRGTRVGNAPIRFTQPGGQTGVVWKMKAGEEIVFRYRDLLGFSENVKLGTTISLRLSTLLFGRYVYHTARSEGGPGLLLLSVKGQVEESQEAVEAFPLERLIAWNKHATFRIADDRTFGAVFKDGFIVQSVRRRGTPSGLVLVGAPSSRTALVQGTVKFVKVFVVPF